MFSIEIAWVYYNMKGGFLKKILVFSFIQLRTSTVFFLLSKMLSTLKIRVLKLLFYYFLTYFYMSVKLLPTDDHIIVKADVQETQTKSGIFIPSTVSKERPQMGEVVAVGPGKMTDEGKRLTMDVKVGDKILFSKYGPSEVKIEGDELLILNAGDVLAIVQ